MFEYNSLDNLFRYEKKCKITRAIESIKYATVKVLSTLNSQRSPLWYSKKLTIKRSLKIEKICEKYIDDMVSLRYKPF